MRNAAFALLLVISSALTPAQAGLLTRGNIFADGLAGCSIGAAIGFVSGMLLSTSTPMAGAAAIPHIGVLGGCLSGVAIAITINGVAYFSDLTQDYLDSHRPLETVTDMVYPETPGKEY